MCVCVCVCVLVLCSSIGSPLPSLSHSLSLSLSSWSAVPWTESTVRSTPRLLLPVLSPPALPSGWRRMASSLSHNHGKPSSSLPPNGLDTMLHAKKMRSSPSSGPELPSCVCAGRRNMSPS
ncbi:hypothetical protein CGRA01v4_04023 [Colletotrichum graminicola]|nr:hypothetical protein CGRA01v4_04023 [Colletotrichum graminicola]